ncbi:MAG: PIG-L family deacetylase [Firmicutes bacterium]|nr:PIG-L family deacetylase [Bacillota bacterium]
MRRVFPAMTALAAAALAGWLYYALASAPRVTAEAGPPSFTRLLVVAAHPDDETIGAGVLMARTRRHGGEVRVLVVNTGIAARRPGDHAALFAERRAETLAALALAGVPPEGVSFLGIPDLGTGAAFPAVVERVRAEIGAFRPDAVVVSAWEGAHPDHDLSHYAVAVATDLGAAVPVWEFPEYNRRYLTTGRRGFLQEDLPFVDLGLTAEETALRRAMMACFPSEGPFVMRFGEQPEMLRPLPRYNYRLPPDILPYRQLFGNKGLYHYYRLVRPVVKRHPVGRTAPSARGFRGTTGWSRAPCVPG